jgi:hypothetical protein
MADRRSLRCNVEFKKMRNNNVGSKILVGNMQLCAMAYHGVSGHRYESAFYSFALRCS